MLLPPRQRPRGFTIVELMIVVMIIGILAAIAIPNYVKITARASRSEMQAVVSKFRLSFRNTFDNQGTFFTSSTLLGPGSSAINPTAAIAIGQPAPWDSTADGWKDLAFPPDGSVRMRYRYSIDATGKQLTIESCGSFPGLGALTAICFGGGTMGNYTYTETLFGSSSTLSSDFPAF